MHSLETQKIKKIYLHYIPYIERIHTIGYVNALSEGIGGKRSGRNMTEISFYDYSWMFYTFNAIKLLVVFNCTPSLSRGNYGLVVGMGCPAICREYHVRISQKYLCYRISRNKVFNLCQQSPIQINFIFYRK